MEKLSLFKMEGIGLKKQGFLLFIHKLDTKYLSVRRDCLYVVVMEGITINTGFMEMKKASPLFSIDRNYFISSTVELWAFCIF